MKNHLLYLLSILAVLLAFSACNMPITEEY